MPKKSLLLHTVPEELQKAMQAQQARSLELARMLQEARPDLSAVWAIRHEKARELAKALEGGFKACRPVAGCARYFQDFH